MGEKDTYCFICGNTCFSLEEMIITDFKNTLENKDAKYKLEGKYYHNILKRIEDKITFINDLKILYKNVKWMNNATMLLTDNTVIHGLRETSGSGIFHKHKESYTQIDIGNDDYLYGCKQGLFIHTDCWKFIKKNYNIELKFSNLPPLLPPLKTVRSKYFDINYGRIEKYWEQIFPFVHVLLAKDTDLCSSPLKEDTNIIQIKKNIRHLHIKKQLTRQGPPNSATLYKTGDIKIGNNKYFWIIKGGKWIEIKEIPQKLKVVIKNISLKQKKWLTQIPFVGQSNTNPIFIRSISFNKNIHNIEFILLEDMKSNIMKYIE